jgi:hypothetical protein
VRSKYQLKVTLSVHQSPSLSRSWKPVALQTCDPVHVEFSRKRVISNIVGQRD